MTTADTAAHGGVTSVAALTPDYWQFIKLSAYERRLLTLYRAHVNPSGTIDEAHEAFDGQHGDASAWALDHLENAGVFAGCPEVLRKYLDAERYALDRVEAGAVTFVQVDSITVWAFVQPE